MRVLMPLSDFATLKTAEWNRMVDVNIKGVLKTTAAVLPYMTKQGSGHIVNTSSIGGRKVFAGLTVYCATKQTGGFYRANVEVGNVCGPLPKSVPLRESRQCTHWPRFSHSLLVFAGYAIATFARSRSGGPARAWNAPLADSSDVRLAGNEG